ARRARRADPRVPLAAVRPAARRHPDRAPRPAHLSADRELPGREPGAVGRVLAVLEVALTSADAPRSESMKALKIAVIALLVYAGIVTAFESLIGFTQPTPDSTIVITTLDERGTPHDRVVSRMVSDGHLYVSANHWPRAWYRNALANPHVQVAVNGAKADYLAVPIEGAEADRVERENPHGM